MASVESFIRNFSIIAHIDHGKSTLADRLLELSGVVTERTKCAQILDSLELERERGITIKAQTASFFFDVDGQTYHFNLIDTPGHVDFSYEVSRSLKACETALLVVDATQGVEAQTVANAFLALEEGLHIIPVINKIDLPGSDPTSVCLQIEEELGLDTSRAILCSAKSGVGVEEILLRLAREAPPPTVRNEKYGEKNKLSAFIFDSWYDNYVGVISLVRLFSGELKQGDQVSFWGKEQPFEILELGTMALGRHPCQILREGEVGYVIGGHKNLKEVRVGDTITSHNLDLKVQHPVPGFKPAKNMVFAGVFPIDSSEYDHLRDSLEKYALSDGSLTYEPDTSAALGAGFRCGFLGLLHVEIVQQRLSQEYDVEAIFTSPSAQYRVILKNQKEKLVSSPADLPPPTEIQSILEPYMKVQFRLPQGVLGSVMELASARRGQYQSMEYLSEQRILLTYRIPMSEMLVDFFDVLKSVSGGYASMDYEEDGWEESDLVAVDILVNGKVVDALSFLTHRSHAYERGRDLVSKLKDVIPRQQFAVALQASLGGRVIARETISPIRKDVTAKCYGGDITRKRKLLEKQKKGKKKMKQIGDVEVPQSAFRVLLHLNS